MKSISEYTLQPIPKTKINSRRSFVISQFLEELNRDNSKPYKPSYIAFKLSHLKIPDMEYLWSTCNDYKRRGGIFAKCMFGSLKGNKK